LQACKHLCAAARPLPWTPQLAAALVSVHARWHVRSRLLPTLTAPLNDLSCNQLEQLDSQTLITTAWGLSVVCHEAPQFFRHAAAVAARRLQDGEAGRALTLQQAGAMAWALGSAAPSAGRLFFEALDGLHLENVPAAGWVAPVDTVARVLWGCACTGHRNARLLARVRVWLDRGQRLWAGDTSSICVVAWCFAALHFAPGARFCAAGLHPQCCVTTRLGQHQARGGCAPRAVLPGRKLCDLRVWRT
jgi:hypothetical protein